jgi:rRNA processing protein Gar1
MPNYKPYLTVKDTPNRKTRKGERVKIFLANKEANRKLQKARKAEKEARLAAQEEITEE